MKKYKEIKITKRLFLSLSVFVFISFILGLMTLNGIHNVSKSTRMIYDHPLVVSNAALQSNVSITKMHRHMKDVVLFNAPDRIQASITSVHLQEQKVYENLDIVKNRILGEKGRELEQAARDLFEAWRPIREEVIQLVHMNQIDKAAEVTIGKGAAHVDRLEKKMLGLTNYAKNKAAFFMEEAEDEHSKVKTTTILFIVSIVLASFFVGFFTLRRTAASETELRESRQLLMNAIDFAPIGMALVEPGGSFYRVNQALCEITGYTNEELTNRSYQDITHPDDIHIGPVYIANLLAEKTDRAQFEKRYVRKDGSTVDVLLTTSLLKKDDGTPLFFFTQIQDITERKAAERREKEATARLRLAMESADEGIWEWDFETGLVSFDAVGLRMLGYGENEIEMPGQWWIDQIHPEDKPSVAKIYGDFISGAIPKYGVEFRLKSKKGRYIWVASTAQIIRKDSHGKPLLVTGIHRDITDRKRSEKALRENEEKYRSLFKSSSDAIVLVDVETVEIVDANVKTAELYGYALEDLRSMKAYELSAEPEKTKQVISVDKDTVIPMRYHKKKDGTVFPVQITANYFTLNDRKTNISTIRDISKIKKFERRFNQAQKMESIGTLAGGIAHDFNNILASIIGFTELSLMDIESGSVIEDNLQEIYSAGKRAKELVYQILAFARQTEGEVKPIQVDTIANEVLKLIRSSIPTTIRIEQLITSDSLIMANATQLHQVFMNLCTNAAQAMEDEGGVLTISIKDIVITKASAQYQFKLNPGEHIEIKVADTGEGMAPDVVDSVFEPYFTTKAMGEGTGLGLSVVHGIVESYGGVIHARSELGKGSVFTIYLPITKKRGTDHVHQAEKLPAGTEQVLLVDDEPSLAELGTKMLEHLGYSVTSRTSSIEALEEFRAKPQKFDLVITDMTMPHMTGDRLAREMIAVRPDIPIILCTGYSKKITEEGATDIGVKALAYKPMIQADLAKIVRKVLDQAKKINDKDFKV